MLNKGINSENKHPQHLNLKTVQTGLVGMFSFCATFKKIYNKLTKHQHPAVLYTKLFMSNENILKLYVKVPKRALWDSLLIGKEFLKKNSERKDFSKKVTVKKIYIPSDQSFNHNFGPIKY